MGESGDGLFFLFSDSRRFSPDSFVFPLIAYRLSLIAYRLSLIAYRLSLIAYRPGLCSQKYQYLSCYFDFPSHASLYGGVQVVLA